MVSESRVGREQHTAVWVVVTLVAGLLVPGAGFVVAAVSALPRFRQGSPSIRLLLVISTAVVVLQVLGLIGLWQSSGGVGPIEIAG